MIGTTTTQRVIFEALWNRVEDGLVVYSAAGERMLANPVAEAFFAEFDSAPARRTIYFADGRLSTEDDWPMRRALRGETIRDEEYVVRTGPDGQARRILVTAFPIELEPGERVALVSFHDLSDRWRDEHSNRTTVDQLNMLLHGAAGYAILQLGPAGEIRSWSPTAERLLGYRESEIVGRPFEAFFLPEDRSAGVPASILIEAAATGSAQTYGPRLRRDGTVFWADGVLTAIRDRAGKIIAYVKVVHDVTDRHLAEAAVEQLNAELRSVNGELEARVRVRTAELEGRTVELTSANAELEAFSYSVSHDLRAPVRAVQGFARIVTERFGEQLPGEAVHYLQRISDGAQRMGDLVDALLRLSRMQRKPLATESIDMTTMVERCWSAIGEQRPGHQVRLDLDRLDPADGDPQLIQQVWMNLLDNAVKYSADAADARVRVTSTVGDDGRVTYRVCDTGAGFDQRYAGRLFEAFQRLHSEEEYAGIGIGLAIVQRVVFRHGGRVWADGEPGTGATFGFTLRRGIDDGRA